MYWSVPLPVSISRAFRRPPQPRHVHDRICRATGYCSCSARPNDRNPTIGYFVTFRSSISRNATDDYPAPTSTPSKSLAPRDKPNPTPLANLPRSARRQRMLFSRPLYSPPYRCALARTKPIFRPAKSSHQQSPSFRQERFPCSYVKSYPTQPNLVHKQWPSIRRHRYSPALFANPVA